MNDPCEKCNVVELRDAFLQQNYELLFRFLPEAKNGSTLEQAFRKNVVMQQKYKHLIEAAPDAIFVADAESGIILEANHSAAELLGIPLEQIIGMHQSLLHPAKESAKYAHIFKEHVQRGAGRIYEEIYVQHSSGQKIPVQINATVTELENKKIILGIFRDITEQKDLELKIKESERNYRQLYQNARMALYRNRIDDSRLLEYNEAFAQQLGYQSRQHCLAECDYTLKHYADPEQRKEFLALLKKEGVLRNYQTELVRCDGSHFWVDVAVKAYPEEGYLEGAHFDITASKVLTNAEKKVLDFVFQGKCNKEIAKILDRSIRTIEDHRSHIMQKLHAHNLIDLVQKAQFYRYEFPKIKKR